jgi:hypothetical protein
MSELIREAYEAVRTPEVQEMIRRLGDHGLGVFIPHQHKDGVVQPLGPDTIQLESNLQISFVSRDDPRLQNSSVIGWTWDKDKARVSAACGCNPDHFPGGCSWQDEPA